MIDMEKQYEKETGEKALYRMGCSDYHTLRYVSWLEAETRKAKSELKEEIARRWDGYTELVIACQNADERIEKLEAELAEMTADRDSEKQWVSEYHLDWVRDRDYAEKAEARVKEEEVENERLRAELAAEEKFQERLESKLATMEDNRNFWAEKFGGERRRAEKAKEENKRLNIELAKMEKAMSDYRSFTAEAGKDRWGFSVSWHPTELEEKWITYINSSGEAVTRAWKSDGEDLNIHEEAPEGATPWKGSKGELMGFFGLVEEDFEKEE